MVNIISATGIVVSSVQKALMQDPQGSARQGSASQEKIKMRFLLIRFQWGQSADDQGSNAASQDSFRGLSVAAAEYQGVSSVRRGRSAAVLLL